jgi:hypothetical protein
VSSPRSYRYVLDAYRRTLLSQARDSPGLKALGDRLLPGMLISLGELRISGVDLIEAKTFNRKKGFHGEGLFFYEGLRSDNDRLATLLHSNLYGRRAIIPFLLRSRRGRPSAEG